MFCFSACSEQQNYKIKDSSEVRFVNITQLTSEQESLLSADYTPCGTDETITLDNNISLNLYYVLLQSEFKTMVNEKDFLDKLNQKSSLDFCFYTDQSKTLKDSQGCYCVYENDIVRYSISPMVSYCEYYKVSNGTYQTIRKILNSNGI